MRRLLLPGFWVSAAAGAGAVIFASITSRPFGYVLAGLFACLAMIAVSAMCWDDVGGKTSLAHLLLGKKDQPHCAGPGPLIDVRSITVVGVFAVRKDLLAHLQGGEGTYRLGGLPERAQWPDNAELFLAWQMSERAAAAATRQLNAWEASHQPLRLVCGEASATVLADSDNRRLTLPALSQVGGDRATHPGRR